MHAILVVLLLDSIIDVSTSADRLFAIISIVATNKPVLCCVWLSLECKPRNDIVILLAIILTSPAISVFSLPLTFLSHVFLAT